ncbi:MAG: oligosaccharide flippase family protein [Actinobacteria bacterium]|nr:oligosaccharide flippase family protein [Actinomycetota bacterium]
MSIARKSILGIGGQIYILIVGLASTVILARLLGPEGKGVLALVAAISSFGVGAASFGLGPALSYLSGKDRFSPRELISAAVVWSLLLGAAVGSATWAFREPLLGSVLEGMTATDLAIALIALPTYYVGAFTGALLAGEGRAVRVAFLQVAAATANIAAVIIASVTAPGDTSVVIIGVSLASAFNATLALVVHRGGLTVSPGKIHGVTRSALPYALKAYVGQATSMFFLRADVFFLNYFAGPSVVGIYSVATSIAEKLWMLSNPVATAVFRNITSSERDDSLRITTLTARSLLVLNGVVGIGLLLVAVVLVPVIYGEPFAEATIYLGLLIPGIVVFALCQPYGHFFAGQLGRPAVTSALSFAMMVLSAILYIVLIPRMGAVGAAIASSIAYSSALLGYAFLLPRAAKVSIRQMLVPTRADFELYRSIAASGVSTITRRWKRG